MGAGEGTLGSAGGGRGLLKIQVGKGSLGHPWLTWAVSVLVPSLPCAVFIAKLLSRRGGTGPGPGYLLLYIVYVWDDMVFFEFCI